MRSSLVCADVLPVVLALPPTVTPPAQRFTIRIPEGDNPITAVKDRRIATAEMRLTNEPPVPAVTRVREAGSLSAKAIRDIVAGATVARGGGITLGLAGANGNDGNTAAPTGNPGNTVMLQPGPPSVAPR